MIILGRFEKYTPPDLDPTLISVGAIFCKNEDGVDWYQLNGFIGTAVLLDDKNRVVSVAKDASSVFPINNTVIELVEGDTAPEVGMIWDGMGFVHPTLTQQDYTIAIQAMLDNAAKEHRYDSAATMATYTNSTNGAWSAEAAAMVAWRDSVWLYAYQQLDAVQSGDREQPSVEELLAELPEPNWPA